MQQLQNGIEVFTNGDTYDLAAHNAKSFNQANVVIPVASVAARDALVKRNGMPVARLDLGGLIEIWDASKSQWTRGFQHAEFTGSTVPDIPNSAPTWGTGNLSRDVNASHYGDIFVSPQYDRVTIPGPGLYSISVRVEMSSAATGTTWVALTNDNNTFGYSSFDIQPGARTGALSLPNLYVPSTQNVRVVFYSATAYGYTLTSRIRVSRVG